MDSYSLVTPEEGGKRLNGLGNTVILSVQGTGYSCHNDLQNLSSQPSILHLTSEWVNKCVISVELQGWISAVLLLSILKVDSKCMLVIL